MRSALAHVRAFAVLLLVEVGIRSLPLPQLCRLLGIRLRPVGAPGPPRTTPLPWWGRHGVTATDRLLARWPFGDTCLRRALLVAHILRPLHPVVCLGLRRRGDGVIGHAWIEVDGQSLDGDLADVLPLQGVA